MARDAPPTPVQELSIHIDSLVKQDQQLLAEQIHLEKKSTAPELPPPGPNVADRTQHFLNGFAHPIAAGLSGGQRLRAILVDRAAIAGALSELERQRQLALAAEATITAKANQPRFLSLVRRATLLATELEAVEAEIAAMRKGLAGQLLPFPEFGFRSIAGVNWSADPVGPARRALLKAGVLTEREIKEAGRV